MRPKYQEVAAACEAGYAAGRARRRPSAVEMRRFVSVRVWAAFRSAYQRGLEARAKLEQIPLPGIVPAADGGVVRPRPREHRGKGHAVAPGGGER